MMERPVFDPFAALAAARGQKTLAEPPKTFAELSQTTEPAFDETNQGLDDNFAAFATFAGGRGAATGSRPSLYLERKKDFSLSLQAVSHGSSRPWLTKGKDEERVGAAPPAKAAILRSEGLSDCATWETAETASAKVSQRDDCGGSTRLSPEDAAAKVFEAQLAFDERAAFLEYECGLSRVDAETQARSEIKATANTAREPERSAPQPNTVEGWRAGLASLNPHRAPCRDYRGSEWSRVLSNAIDFLDAFGTEAHALGWQTHELFGVHPEIGTVRPDYCGALVLGVGGPVRQVTVNEIRFGHLTHHKLPGKPQGVPIWAVGR